MMLASMEAIALMQRPWALPLLPRILGTAAASVSAGDSVQSHVPADSNVGVLASTYRRIAAEFELNPDQAAVLQRCSSWFSDGSAASAGNPVCSLGCADSL
jgi:hypothetical protein